MIFVAIIVSFSLLSQIGCQESAKQPEERLTASPVVGAEAKAGPKITFEKVVHDFGEVAPRTKKTCEFKFTNTGNSLLKIIKIERCCGVTTKLDKKQYEPTESGTIKVEYNASSGAAFINRKLHIVSNDKTNPKMALTIKAKIVPKISYEPNSRLGFLIKDEQSPPDITITSLEGKPFAIKEIRSTGNCITFDYDPNTEATKFVLQPKIDEEKLQRNPHGIINIKLTYPQGDNIKIPFNRIPRFKIIPPRIIAFNAKQGQPIIRKMLVQNNYGENFEIESASSQNKTIRVLSQDKIKNGYQFMLEIMPPPDEGKSSFTDVFLLNITCGLAKGGKKLPVSCNGFYMRERK